MLGGRGLLGPTSSTVAPATGDPSTAFTTLPSICAAKSARSPCTTLLLGVRVTLLGPQIVGFTVKNVVLCNVQSHFHISISSVSSRSDSHAH